MDKVGSILKGMPKYERANLELLKKEGMSRDFKGVWIPKEIWLNPNLSLVEKLLLGEIDSLDQGEGCFASNKYFSIFFKQKNQSIANALTILRKKGFIIDRKFDGRRRWISVNDDKLKS